jgi:hypothetical protein
MEISNEALADSAGDILGQIQQREISAYIARERAWLAAATSNEVAWTVFPPTRHDDPAEYAPYWVRLTDIADH